MTQEPIAPGSDSPVKFLQVLHMLLRTFDAYMKCVVHLKANVFVWTESKFTHPKNFAKISKAKKEIQDMLVSKHSVKWDFVNNDLGTSTTGNTVRFLLSEEPRKDICEMISNPRSRALATTYGSDLSMLIEAMSSGSEIDIEKYSETCTTLYVIIATELSWTNIVNIVIGTFGRINYSQQ